MAQTTTLTDVEIVTVTIDGKSVNVPKGTRLIEAAYQAGADVPYFCHHPRLSPAGACRMCLVRIEKMNKLQTACTVPCSDGMVVDTISPEVKQAQQGILEFLLINHPLDCPICDRGGECPLQNMTFQYGPGATRFIDEKRHFPKPVPLSDYVSIDRERCIQCARCTRFQAEIAGDTELSIQSRGNSSFIAPFTPDGFQSKFSGNTIELCPVGALLSRPYRFVARPWDFHSADSVCSMCGVGCNVVVQSRNGKVTRINARENNDVNEEWTCDKGKFEQYWVNSKDRVLTPLIRKNGELVPASWDEALSVVAEGLGKIAAENPAAIAGIGSARISNEEAYLFQKVVRDGFGSPNVDHRLYEFPIAPMQNSIAEIGAAKNIVAVGFEPKEYAPVLWLWIYKAISKSNAIYSNVESLDDPAVSAAVKEGAGSIILVSDKVDDKAYEKIEAAAKKSGAKLSIVLPKNNSWGAINMGLLPDALPGGKKPSKKGLATWQVFKHSVGKEPIKGLYILGSDPVKSFPHPDAAKKTIEEASFVVVQDLFLTETAKLADVVLPASSFAEKSGHFTNIEGRIQKFDAAFSPLGESLPDGEILISLLEKLGKAENLKLVSDVARLIEE
jgi:NADH-quinone oxidoreductase subunit G